MSEFNGHEINRMLEVISNYMIEEFGDNDNIMEIETAIPLGSSEYETDLDVIWREDIYVNVIDKYVYIRCHSSKGIIHYITIDYDTVEELDILLNFDGLLAFADFKIDEVFGHERNCKDK